MSTYESQPSPYAYTPVPVASTSHVGTPDPTQVAGSSTPVMSQQQPQQQLQQSQSQQQHSPQSRQAAEEARKDRTLAEFLLMLDDYEPLVRFVGLSLMMRCAAGCAWSRGTQPVIRY